MTKKEEPELKQKEPMLAQDEHGFMTVTRSRRVLAPPVRYNPETCVTAIQKNYYAALAEICEDKVRMFEDATYKIAAVGAGLGGGFEHTSELKVMKYSEAMSGPDKKEWEEEVENEHKRMKYNKAWEPIHASQVPKGAKKLTTTWAMKLKANGKRIGRVNARGYEQKAGVHYTPNNIAAPVVNDTTMKIIFAIGLEAKWIFWILDTKGAFLKDKF